MTTKLHQIIAVEKGIKNQSNQDITAAYHKVQKPDLFSGIARTYSPVDEEGEKFPPEHKKVQERASDLLSFTAETMTKYWDVTVTKDTANCSAKANVVVDGRVILKDVPVTFLLFLEKQLGDLITMVKKLPTLDPGESWNYDETQDCHATEPAQTTKTKKVPKAFTASPATKEHPAQVQVFTEDVIAGYWKTVKYSGALPQKRVSEILDRILKFQAAVKFAREEANSIPSEQINVGKTVFGYLFA
jgi:hypothetical protein